jgi:YHS domain-containing protein
MGGRPAFMIRFLIVRLLLPLIALLLIRGVIRTLVTGFQTAARRTASGPQAASHRDIPSATELKKDPVCGTYVSTATSLTRTINGKQVHFCSEECLNKYRAA